MRNRLSPDFDLFYINKSLADQGIDGCFVHTQLLPGFCPGNWRGLLAQKIKEGHLFQSSFLPERG